MSLDYTVHYAKFHNDSTKHIDTQKRYYSSLFKKSIFRNTDKNISILEIGCGRGYGILTLNEAGYKNIIGVEISEGQYNYCKSQGYDVYFTNNTIDFLKNISQRFDFVLAFDVLEHIPKQEQVEFCKAISEVLKPDGRFMLTTPNANSVFASRYRYIDWTHTTSFTEHSVDFVLKTAGFKAVMVGAAEARPAPTLSTLFSFSTIVWLLIRLNRLFRRIECYLELGKDGLKIPLSLNLLVTATK